VFGQPRGAPSGSHTDSSVRFGESQRGLDRHAETRVTLVEPGARTNARTGRKTELGRVQDQPSSVSKDGSRESKGGSTEIFGSACAARSLRWNVETCSSEEPIGGRPTKVVQVSGSPANVFRTFATDGESHDVTREQVGSEVCVKAHAHRSRERECSAGSPALDQAFCVWAAGRKTAARWSRCPRQEVRSSVRRARTERRPCATERLLRKSFGQQRERASSEVRPDPATGLREGAK
jgi:hypothetical protein